MNRRLIAQLAKSLAAYAASLEGELERSRAHDDPLVVWIYKARKEFRNVPETKSGKRRSAYVWYSFQRAGEYGFRGSKDMWRLLLESPSHEREGPPRGYVHRTDD